MNKILFLFLCSYITTATVQSQSLELTAGNERIFVDVQWLEFFNGEMDWSLFSRTRSTVDYENDTNLFTGAYLNYTTVSGFGGTVVGRVASAGSGLDIGVHYFKTRKSFMTYALASLTLIQGSGINWFSITRFTPTIIEAWKLYTSIELFSSFDYEQHQFSTQRLRLGLDSQSLQFGIAVNISETGKDVVHSDTNPGIFIRKQF